MNAAAIRAAMNSSDVEVRRDAVLAAGALRDRDTASALLAALGDADWRVREEAIRVVSEVAVEFELIKPLIDGLCQGLNVGLRNAAREVLRRLGAAAARALVTSLSEVEPNDRKFIVEALACGGTEEATDTLIESVRGSDAVIAVAAMDALAQLGGPRATAALRDKLRTGDTFERAAALDALEHLAATVQYDDLAPIMEDRLLRRIALDALGRSGDVRAVPHLLLALSDRSTHVTNRALLGLFRLQGANVDARRLLCSELPRNAQAVAALKTAAGDEDRTLGLAAATLLARAQDSEAVAIAVQLVAADVAANQLAVAFDDWTEDALGTALRMTKDRAEQRAAALDLACELGERVNERPAAVEQLREVLRGAFDDSDVSVRVSVLRGLGRFGDAADAALLLGSTAEADADVAVAAGNALRDLAFRAPAAVRQVLTHATPSGPAGLAVAELLVDLGTKDAHERLREALLSDESSTRACAIAGLSRLGGPAAAELVALALRDDNQEVQVAALEALTVMRDRGDEGTRAILDFESKDSDVLCAHTLALSSLDDPRAPELLQVIARTGPREARVAALQALVGLGGTELQPLLAELAVDPDPEVAKQAISELGTLANGRSPAAIAAALSHNAAEVRRLSAAWLGRIGDTTSSERLFDRLEHETDVLVRNVIVEALEALREVR
jgi:HEAT repeat protein